jgi:RHS repeat-associated protein
VAVFSTAIDELRCNDLPLISISADNVVRTAATYASKQPVLVAFSATDHTSAAHVSATLDGVAFSGGTITPEGEHRLLVHAVDDAGNIADAALRIVIDSVAPVIKVTDPSGNVVVSPASVRLPSIVLQYSATDSISAVSISAKLDGADYASGSAIGIGVHVLVLHAEDEAHNVADVTLQLVIDDVAPVVTLHEGSTLLDASQTPAFAHTPAIDVTVADNLPGVTSTITLGYDPQARLRALTFATGQYTLGYNSAGLLASAANADETLTYGYDGTLSTSTTWTGVVSGSVTHTYDALLRVASENGVSFAYDNDGLLTVAGNLTMTRDAQSGFLTATQLGTIADAFTYDTYGALSTYSANYLGTALLSDTYTRDDVGRITAKAETFYGATTTYDYDTAGRLASVTKNGTPVASYTYDGNGNRLTKATGATSEAATYEAQDRLLTYTGTSYSYTATGELATKTDASGVTTYAYDALGNLRTVLLSTGKRIDYVIDAQNRRVGKKVDGTLVQGWLYADQLRIVAELDGSGAVVSRFIYGTRSNVPDYMIRGTETYRIIADHLGSSRLVINTTSSAVAEAIDYDEFGNVLSDTAAGFQPFGFAGGLRDTDTGLVRFGARDYDMRVGRWTTKDPISFRGGDFDLYNYAMGDPLNLLDANGRETCVAIWPLSSGEPHSMMKISRDENGSPLLWDPNGNYPGPNGQGGPRENPGREFSGDQASFGDYLNFWRKRGSSTPATFCEATTADQEAELARRIHAFGQDGVPYVPWCTFAVSSVLSGAGPFASVTPVYLPGSLQSEIEKIQH